MPHYPIEIARPKNLDEMTVLVERSPVACSADGEAAVLLFLLFAE